MTSRSVKIAFGAGAALAGIVLGAARLAGLDEPPAAIAEVAAPAAPADAATSPAASPPRAEASPQWRVQKKDTKREEVPAGILARVASRRGASRPTCPAQPAAAGAPRAAAPATASKASTAASDGCAPSAAGQVESVEIEWHAPSPTH